MKRETHTSRHQETKPRQLAILGSTGSIGTQTLDVVRQHPDQFEARVLTAGDNADLLIRQAREFMPDAVVIANEDKYVMVCEALADLPIKVYAGAEALCGVVEMPSINIVVAALVGFAGLPSTIRAIEARKTIALANKETLVVAGALITSLAVANRVPILPVDSEHSAIFQSLAGETQHPIEKILLTASGGPFRNHTSDELKSVTAAQALQHPNWEMGAKITIDSATMMNKGFEMIEAQWLFGVAPKNIEVLIHPESIIHSAVQFADGSVKAQMAMPDMRLPIQYALAYPQRLTLNIERINFYELGAMHFARPDTERFRCLAIAYEAAARGGNVPCVVNAANEVANLAFRQGKISFPRIAQIIDETTAKVPFSNEATLECFLETDREARIVAQALIS